MSQSAEKLPTIVRAMSPVVAGCRSSGGQNGGQDHGPMSPLTHHSWTVAKYCQVSPFRGRLHFLMRPMSPSVAQCCGSMGQNRGSRQFRWEVTRTLNLRLWRPNPTRRVVSGNVVRCRFAPLSLSSDAAACRRVSAVTGAHSGAPQSNRTLYSYLALVQGCRSNRRPKRERCSVIRGSWTSEETRT
jgi:hypothetical protein